MAYIKDLTGQRFGRLVVVELKYKHKKYGAVWTCLCDCGKTKIAKSKHLQTKGTQSCGCINRERRNSLGDLTGTKFGHLVVTGFSHINEKTKLTYWKCACDCGNNTTVRGTSLRSATRSCGCKSRKSQLTHGKAGSRTYHTWEGMTARCTNPNNKKYKDYGNKGISICSSWKTFANFLADMGDRPPNKILDRIDNSKGYSKENCRWVTFMTSNQNRRNTVRVEFEGQKLTLFELARKTHIPQATIRQRLRAGWSLEKIVTTPSKFFATHGYPIFLE